MNNTGGALNFHASLYQGDINKAIDSINRRFVGMGNTAVSESKRIDSAFANMGRMAAGGAAAFGLAQIPGQIVKIRGEFQQLEIALNTMLQSKGKADKLMGELIQTAATTPFGLKDLASGTKQLIAYGSSAETVMSEIRMLGDVASGVSQPIGDLIYLYGTLRTQGRAYAVDIRQFAGRGIPIYNELAKVLKVQVGEVNALVEAGKVGFPQVEQAFRNMTSTGGMFGGLMEAQSKSLPGLIERLKDAVDIMYNDIGKANQGLAEDVIKSAAFMVEHYQEIIDVLTVLTATYGAYKAAVILTNVVNTTATSSAYIAEAGQLSTLIGVEAQARISKAGLIAGSTQHAAAVHLEVAALVESNAAQLAQMRLLVSTSSLKKAETLAAAKAAMANLADARARLVSAQANQAATASFLNAKIREGAIKEVEKAQNAVIAAQENAAITRKAALGASSAFYTNKLALETAATSASTVTKNVTAAADVRLTAVQSLRIAVMRQMIALQTAFNASMLSNPIVLTTVAIVGLAAAMWALNDSTTAQEHAQQNLNTLTEEAARKKQELESKTSSLNGVIRDENQTKYAQLKAFTDLQKLYPAIIGQMKLLEFQALSTADAQKLLNRAMEEAGKSDARSGYDNAVKKVAELEEKIKRLTESQQGAGQGAGGYAVQIANARKELEASRITLEGMTAQQKEQEQLEWLSKATNAEKLEFYEAQVKAKKAERDEFEKMATSAALVKKIFAEMSLLGINKEIKDLAGSADALKKLLSPGVSADDGGNEAHWEKVKKTAKDERSALGHDLKGSDKWIKLTKEINNADEKLKAYNTTQKKVAEKDKIQTEGSIARWNQIASKAKEAIEKTNVKDSASIKKQQAILENAEMMAEQARLKITPYGTLEYWEQVEKIATRILSSTPNLDAAGIEKQKIEISNAQAKADEIRKALAVRSFDEELEYKKGQYELYERWVLHMGGETAKGQFKALLNNGSSYADFLNAEIQKLQTQKDTPGIGLFGPEEVKLEKLKSLVAEVTGTESPLTKFQKRLDTTRESSASLTDEIIELQKIQAELGTTDMSTDGIAKRQLTAEQLIEAHKERKRLLADFLVNVAGSEERQTAIQKKYADMRAAIDERYTDKKSAAYLSARAKINNAEKSEMEQFSDEAVKATKAYKELERALNRLNSSDTKERIRLEKELLKTKIEGTDEYLAQLDKVKDAEKAHQKNVLDGWSSIGGMVADLGGVLSNYEGTLGQLGSTIQGLGSAASQVSNTFKNMDSYKAEGGGLTMDGYVAAAQSVIQIISGIIEANQRRIQAERQFAAERLGFENDYQLALIQKEGDNYKKNPFYTDYEGKVKAGVTAYKSAFDKYQEAIDKLEEGKAKERQKNVVDGKTTLGMVGSGAAAGAIIGTAIGGWAMGIGTVVGTVVGAVVGLIGGLVAKKKKDVFGSLMDHYPELVKETADGWAELDLEMAKSLLNNNQVDDKTRKLLENAIALNEELQKAREQIRDTAIEMVGAFGDNLRDALVGAFKAGETAASALRKTVGSIIADVATKLLFSKIMGPALDKLVEDMAKSMEKDGTPVGAMDRFNEYGLEAAENLYMGIEALEKWLKEKGYDGIMGSGAKDQAKQGVIQGVSEASVSLLIGQMNAVRIYQADMAGNTRLMVLHLVKIEMNTARTNTILFDVVDELKSLKQASLRGFGLS